VLRIYKFLLMATLIAVAFLLPEFLSRFLFPEWKPPASDRPSLFVHSPHTGWTHPASTAMDHYGGTITGNLMGLRGEDIGEKDRPRVLFLGDSFTWGWGIGKDEERYTDQLQQRLPDYQIINAGIIGFNTLQAFLLLRHYYENIKPDYLVLQMFANDFPENLTGQGIYPRPHFDFRDGFSIKNHPAPVDGISWIKKFVIYLGENTYLYRQIIVRIFVFLLDFGMTPEEKNINPSDADLLEGAEKALQLIFQFAGEHQLPVLVIFSAMNGDQIKIIESTADRYNVKTVNIDPAFDFADHEWKDHTEHWNAYGHALVADHLYLYLVNFISVSHE